MRSAFASRKIRKELDARERRHAPPNFLENESRESRHIFSREPDRPVPGFLMVIGNFIQQPVNDATQSAL